MFTTTMFSRRRLEVDSLAASRALTLDQEAAWAEAQRHAV